MKNEKIHLFLYSILIIIGSSISSTSIPDKILLTPDKLLHFFEYLFFGIFCFRVVNNRFSYPIICVSFLSFLFGIVDESWQSLIPGRDPSFFDLIADVIGGVVGSFIAFYFLTRKK